MDNEYLKEEYYRENFEEFDSIENSSKKEIFFRGYDEGFQEGVNSVRSDLLSITGDEYPNESVEDKFKRLINAIVNYENYFD